MTATTDILSLVTEIISAMTEDFSAMNCILQSIISGLSRMSAGIPHGATTGKTMYVHHTVGDRLSELSFDDTDIKN